MKKVLVGLLVGLALLSFQGPASAVQVGVELALLVDVSGSIDATEYSNQKNGYAAAFNDPVLQGYIQNTPGGVAVTYIEWSSYNQQSTRIGWTLLDSAADATAFATQLGALSRAFDNNTAPGSAINYATPLFTGNGYEGLRLIMDVSGDGIQNSGDNTKDASDAAYAAKITVNGLAIGGSSIDTWYLNNVVSTGGLLFSAEDFDDFEAAIKRKLFYEIGQVPEPATLLLLGVGLIGLAGFGRKKI